MRGKGTASRPGTPSRSQKLRSELPQPQAGGMPYSSISTKSMSSIWASSSPASRMACCSLKRRSWSRGSFNSEKPFPISVPAMMGWKRWVTSGWSGSTLARGLRVVGSWMSQ